MRTEFDVVIAGGGVMGSACAYFLHSTPEFRGSILVVEPDPSYRESASTRSASSIRQQFSTPLNIALSAFGMQFLRDAPRRWAHTGVSRDLGLIESSYLFLATAQGRAALAERVAIQHIGVGAGHVARSTGACAALPVAQHRGSRGRIGYRRRGRLVRRSCAARGAARANERSGVLYVRDRVIGFEQSADRRILAANLQEAGRITCRYAVNTAGTRSRELAASAGVDLPVFPRKRSVFVFTCPVSIPNCPLVIDPSGLWFRSERDRFLCGPPRDARSRCGAGRFRSGPCIVRKPCVADTGAPRTRVRGGAHDLRLGRSL